MKKHLNFLFLSIIVSLLLVSCGSDAKEQEPSTKKSKIQTVEVLQPRYQSFLADIKIIGKANANRVVLLHAMESGVVRSVLVDIGDQVQKDQTLALIQNPELYQQENKLKSDFNVAKSAYDRLKDIYKITPALINAADVEESEGNYLASKARLEAIENRIAYLTIKAPFSGFVTKRLVDIGSLVQNGMKQSNPIAMFEIQQTNPIRLTVEVPEADAFSVKVGTEVGIEFPELSGANVLGKVTRSAKVLDPASKTMRVEIDLPNKNNKIVSGMYANVSIKLQSRTEIISLPLSTKFTFKNEDCIWIVENGKAKRIGVKVGLRDASFFEVLNTDIDTATFVVLAGKGRLVNGQSVQVSKTNY